LLEGLDEAIDTTLSNSKNHVCINHPCFHYLTAYHLFDHSVQRKLHLKTPAMQALDLAVSNLEIKSEKCFDRDKEDARDWVLSTFLTTKEYLENMMYGPSGYYTSGKVNFKNDFKTIASNPKTVVAFAAGFAHQLFLTWQNMLDSKSLAPGARFNVLECGAGNGDLCYHILDVTKKMGKFNAKWNAFYTSLYYFIVECVPTLVTRQTARVAPFQQDAKNNDKVKIITQDARYFKTALGQTKMAAVISNELLDMLPPHELILRENATIDVGIVIPYINALDYKRYFSPQSKVQLTTLEKRSKANFIFMKTLWPELSAIENGLILGKKDFLYLHSLNMKDHPDKSPFKFLQHALPSNYFPEVQSYLTRHPPFTHRMLADSKQYPVMGMNDLVDNIDSVLLNHGTVMMVDYGVDDDSLVNQVKGFSSSPNMFENRYNIFDHAGKKDLTVDVRFGDWVREGNRKGFQLEFFGGQIHMSPPQSLFPVSILPADSVHEFKDSTIESYKICVQHKITHPHAALNPPMNRFSSPSTPVSGYSLFKHFADKQREQSKQGKSQVARKANEKAGRNPAGCHAIR